MSIKFLFIIDYKQAIKDERKGEIQMRNLTVLVSGKRACFTNSIFGTERFTYPVMTKTAAAGLLRAIYGKPEFEYVIDSIEVLNEIQYETFKVNEVKDVLEIDKLYDDLKSGKRKNKSKEHIVTGQDTIIQRNITTLRDVRYLINFKIVANHCEDEENGVNTLAKHYEIFKRRIQKGQCYNTAYLGCREFSVSIIQLLEDTCEIEKIKSSGYYYFVESHDLGKILTSRKYYTDESGKVNSKSFCKNAVLSHGVVKYIGGYS